MRNGKQGDHSFQFQKTIIFRKNNAFHFILNFLERYSVHYMVEYGLQWLQYRCRVLNLFWNSASYFALRYKQYFFHLELKRVTAIFLSRGCRGKIRGWRRNSIVHIACNRRSCLFWDTISINFKWIMICGPAFINKSGHIKNLKIITRTVDFGIPNLEIFFNKNNFGVR